MPRRKTEKGERKIEELRQGRVFWQSGDEHPLDTLFEGRDQLRAQLPGELARLQEVARQAEARLSTILEVTQESEEDPAALFTRADHTAHREIVRRFHDRKHYSHLQAQFAIQRYRRLLGRLQAIGAALDLANGLLSEEEVLSPEYLAAWRVGEDEREEPQEEIQTNEELQQEGQADEMPGDPAPPLTKEERRLQGIDEPLAAITGTTKRSRELLRDFETRLPELRKHLAMGQGWFEVFYVPKRKWKPEIVAYATALTKARERKSTVPEEIERAVHPVVRAFVQAGDTNIPSELREYAYNIVEVGPYVKYRWREARQTYSISLGLDDDYPPVPFVSEGF